MRRETLGLLMLGCILAGCDRHDAVSGSGPKSPGRYAGIGIVEAGRLWSQAAGVPASKNPAAAKLEDDEHVIIVIDSHTGEVRQCGDHSGYCVAMNPWTGTAPRASTPVKLTKHMVDLIAEDQAANAEVNSAATKPVPTR
jgi:hypothetical protein